MKTILHNFRPLYPKQSRRERIKQKVKNCWDILFSKRYIILDIKPMDKIKQEQHISIHTLDLAPEGVSQVLNAISYEYWAFDEASEMTNELIRQAFKK